jgi:hypothetical protein
VFGHGGAKTSIRRGFLTAPVFYAREMNENLTDQHRRTIGR